MYLTRTEVNGNLKSTLTLAFTGLLFTTLLAGCAGRTSGELIDDVALSTQVKTALLADSVTDGLDIEVETYRGVVQLNGVADTADERAHAEELAAAVDYVARVENNLIVRDTRRTGEYIDDKVLQGRVNAAFAADPVVRAIAIDVETHRGIVMLGGFVDSEDVRTHAERVTRSVQGVAEVRNNLSLR